MQPDVEGHMRAASLVVATLAVFGLSACSDNDATIDYTLNEDLALAESGEGIALAPKGGGRGTISAVEQIPQRTQRVAPAERAKVARATTTRHQVPLEPVVEEPQQSEVVAAVEEEVPQVAVESTPAPVEATPEPTPAARPHPVDVEVSNPADVGRGPRGTVVVIRGGVVDGDHCDPRVDRRRSGVLISVNNRIPVTPRF
jgi:hypothetical protein